jgi:hypothetical protein
MTATSAPTGAKCYGRREEKEEARAAWQRALTADPDNVLLGQTVRKFAPTMKAPKPPPALEPAPRTSV